MILPTIAAIATAAPLVVAVICLFVWRKLGGGRHLLFWAVGHFALAPALAIVGFTDWINGLTWYTLLPATTGSLTSAVMLAAGIRILVGQSARMTSALVLSIALTATVTVAQHLHDLLYFGATNFVTAAIVLYAGALLLRHRRSVLYTATAIVILARGGMAVLYATQLLGQSTALEATLSMSIFANLLTGLGLIMIEFDNARQRERHTAQSEQETRQFLETVLDSMPATLTYKDRDLRYRIVNRQMRLLISRYGDVIGRTWSEVAGVDAAAVVENMDRKVLATGEPMHIEQGWTGPDGKPLVIWALKMPLKDGDNRIQGVMTCGVDITRLKETETQLIEQREAAEAASRAKSAFLANMSHELRTPLNAIIGFAEMMAAGYLGALSGRQQEYADHIQQSGQHLLRLVSDILDLSRLESGRLEIAVADCGFDAIAQSALAMVEPQAQQAGVALRFSPTGLTVRADERALTQILVNLLGNAVKFNRPGGSVALQVTATGGVVRIGVEDTGIGMSDAESRAAIQPFHRVDAYRARANSGAGLGLSICRSLVELHGGRLEIRSRPGEGTIVEVALPA